MGGWGPGAAEVPCRYWAKGGCSRGNACPFAHTPQAWEPKATMFVREEPTHVAEGIKISERGAKEAEAMFGPANEEEAVRNLMINYIPNEISEQDLLMLFSVYGPVRQARIIHDMKTKQSKGYGFVRYMYGFSAYSAMAFLNGYRVFHKALKVSYADQETASRLINTPAITNRWRDQQPLFIELHVKMQQGEYAHYFARKCIEHMYAASHGRPQ